MLSVTSKITIYVISAADSYESAINVCFTNIQIVGTCCLIRLQTVEVTNAVDVVLV